MAKNLLSMFDQKSKEEVVMKTRLHRPSGVGSKVSHRCGYRFNLLINLSKQLENQ